MTVYNTEPIKLGYETFAPGAVELYETLKIVRLTSGQIVRKPAVKIWRGKQANPFVFYLFKNELERERFIAQEKGAEVRKNAFKAERKAARLSVENTFKVGDLVKNSWGYDQTNIDFYQVVRVLPKSVVVRAIRGEVVRGTGPDSADVRAIPNAFKDDAPEVLRRVTGPDTITMEFGIGRRIKAYETFNESWGH